MDVRSKKSASTNAGRALHVLFRTRIDLPPLLVSRQSWFVNATNPGTNHLTYIRAATTWDNASQLTSLTYKKADGSLIGDLGYTYDLAGQRTAISGSLAASGLPDSVSASSHDDNNRLTAWNGATLTWDDNGNLLSDGTRSYRHAPQEIPLRDDANGRGACEGRCKSPLSQIAVLARLTIAKMKRAPWAPVCLAFLREITARRRREAPPPCRCFPR